MIDTHCHLTFPDFAGRLDEVLARARAHGVEGAITISTTTRDCRDALAVARRYPGVWCSAGVHPLHSDDGEHDWGALRHVAADPRCVAWGELGLDNHYDRPARAIQRRVLDEQLAHILSWRAGADGSGAPGLGKPIVIHCREAFADLVPILRAAGLPGDRFVFHCFTGSEQDMRLVLDFGAMVSFTGVITYRNADDVRRAARLAPIDRVMVETDAPFLSPEPRRGERPCEPWMTSLTARRLAEVRGEPCEAFLAAVDRNTEQFFGVRAPEARGASA